MASWRNRLWAYIGGIARENGMKALAIGGTDDHVHALCRCDAGRCSTLTGSSRSWASESVGGAALAHGYYPSALQAETPHVGHRAETPHVGLRHRTLDTSEVLGYCRRDPPGRGSRRCANRSKTVAKASLASSESR